MPQLNYSVKFELNPEDVSRVDIQDIINSVKESRNKLGTDLFADIIQHTQQTLLDTWIGKKYDLRHVYIQEHTHDIQCPTCESNTSGFCRRGTITRTLTSSIGIVQFKLHRISCKKCGKKFSPFQKIFGIEKRTRVTDELLRHMISMVTELSYEKTSVLTKQFIGTSVSGKTLWNKTQQYGVQIKNIIAQTAYPQAQVGMSDSTKVKAGNKDKHKRGLDAHLVIATTQDETKIHKRTHFTKQILAFGISQTTADIRTQIMNRKENLKLLILDGEPGVRQFIMSKWKHIDIQRCIWHIFRQTGYFLWKDGVAHTDREHYKQQLKQIIYSTTAQITVKNLQYEFTCFVQELRSQGLTNTANHLANALPDVFTFRKHSRKVKKGKWIAQSLIERAMREINRRADIGNRWSDKGAENLLRLRLVKNFQPELFNKIFNKSLQHNHSLILSVDRMPI